MSNAMLRTNRDSPGAVAVRWACQALLAFLAAACSPGGMQLPEGLIESLIDRKSGLIAYVGVDGNIHTIDQRGGRESAVTQDADLSPEGGLPLRFYDYPTWAPGGDNLAFIGASISQANQRTMSVYTAGLSGEQVAEVYRSRSEPPIYLYWSPDGQHLTFLTSGNPDALLALQIVPADGGEAAVIDIGQPYYWAWSPAEPRILAHVGGSARANPEGARLSFLTPDGSSTETRLKLAPSLFQAPAYSPEGEFVLFAAETDDGRQALMLGSADGQVRAVLVVVQGAVTFAWEPGGNHVAYVVNDNPAQNPLGKLSFVNLEDLDDPKTIVTAADDVVGFFWSPTGERLAYFAPVFVLDSGEEASVAPQQARLFLAIRVIDFTTGAIEELVSFRPTQQFLNILPFYDQYQRSATIWSPDGDHLVYSAVDRDGSPRVFVIPSSGGEPRPLAEGTLAFWSWE